MKPPLSRECFVVRAVSYLAAAHLLLAAFCFLRTGTIPESALRLPEVIAAGLLTYLVPGRAQPPAAPPQENGPDEP